MLTLARWLWKSSWYCRARGVLLTVTQLKLTVTHNTTIIWANGTVSVKIRLTCTTCHCWKSPNAFQRQTLLVYSAQKRRHNAVSKCKIYWCYEIRALPLGVSSPEVLGDGDSPDISFLKVMAELPLTSHSPHQHHLFLYSVLISILVRIVLCKLKRRKNAVLSVFAFILFIVQLRILKTLSFLFRLKPAL